MPLLLETPMIETYIQAVTLHLGVEMVTPGDAQILGRHPWRHTPAVLLRFTHIFGARRGANHLATGFDVGIVEDETTMRILFVLEGAEQNQKAQVILVPIWYPRPFLRKHKVDQVIDFIGDPGRN